MIVQVANNLMVGDMEGCKHTGSEAIIHACKFPCYHKVIGRVDKQHPNYLTLEAPNDLYLNIVDSEKPLFYPETFQAAMRFIKMNIDKRMVIIHCNEGLSRAPTIAMLHLFGFLPYFDALEQFHKIYPYFNPSFGIDQFMENNWRYL